MATEKDFETLLARYPEIIEDGLQLIGRQVTMYGRRMDLVFKDRFERQLITELKWGPIKDEHIGQLMSYEGMLLCADDPTLRVMLIGTRVPPNIRRSLDHHGIAWKEIPARQLLQFLATKSDPELASVFEDADGPQLQPNGQRALMDPKPVPAPQPSDRPKLHPLSLPWIEDLQDLMFEDIIIGETYLSIYEGSKDANGRGVSIGQGFFPFEVDWIDRRSKSIYGVFYYRVRVQAGRKKGRPPERVKFVLNADNKWEHHGNSVFGYPVRIAALKGEPLELYRKDRTERVAWDKETRFANPPAGLFVPTERRWLQEAVDFFRSGRTELYFKTDAKIGQAVSLPIAHVYFKIGGETSVCARASFIEVTPENPGDKRLPGQEKSKGLFYYGFRDLKFLATPLPLGDLKYFTSGRALRNDVPGACIVRKPDESDGEA